MHKHLIMRNEDGISAATHSDINRSNHEIMRLSPLTKLRSILTSPMNIFTMNVSCTEQKYRPGKGRMAHF